MNCRHFQNRLHEYLEGTLSAGAKATADKHLAQCSACREAVRQEQQLAQFLSERLRQGTETLALGPEVQRRILTALEHQSTPLIDEKSIAGSWGRLAWPLAVAASLLLIATFLLINYSPGARVHETEMAQSSARDIHSAVSIQVSYRVPTYKFHQEGNLVVDTLSDETIVASGTLWPDHPEPAQQKSERNSPL
jgi:predicted anti-sigma-YlaC factor YlaD